MGFVDEVALARVEADVHNMEPAPYAEGVVLDIRLIKKLGPEFVRRHQFIPVKGGALPLLFTSAPIDSSVRLTIEAKTGMSVRVLWWPRLRGLQALHNALGDRLPSWAASFYKDNPIAMTLAGEQT